MAGSEAQRLLAQLVGDSAFRAKFEADPAEAARAAGYHRLADDLAVDDGDPMMTLEMRESKSSLAGALMAAAAEGIALFEFGNFGAAPAQAAVAPHPRHPVVAPDAVAQPPAAAAAFVQPAAGVADSPAARLAAQAEHVAAHRSTPASAPVNPDDLQGNADDEDAGADETDGSNENEPDENEPDDSGDGSDGGSDDDSDAAGEGSNGEDASDGASDGASHGGSHGGGASHGGDASDGAADLTPSRYPGDNAPQSQIAAWMAAGAERRGLPPELPLMAALVESGLKNDNYGDADSIGFFQMRTSIWDEGPYKGYGSRPQLQLNWFLDHAQAVKQQRLAAGLSVGPRHYGDWIADVERPAEQYRGRYQLRLEEARSLLEAAHATPTASSASTGNEAQVLPAVHPHEVAGHVADLAVVRTGIVTHARSFVGTPYVWGGSSPNGFDCSGFVQYVYKEMGVDLPRVSYQQANTGQRIPLTALRPGDLVAWDNSSRNPGADHIAIYIGKGQIAEAPSPGIDLRIRTLGSDEGAWGVRILGRKG
ncbi:MAG: hypothetical protein JWO11_1320 [Nocardioides sp.]|nr:hypothetical protein [Nocardioides sp.]